MQSEIHVQQEPGTFSETDTTAVAVAYLNAQKKTLSSYYRFSCYVIEKCDLNASLITQTVNAAILAIIQYGRVLAVSSAFDQTEKAKVLRLSKNQKIWIKKFCVTNQIDIPWWVS